MQYTTIQNWSSNVYNLVTKRAAAYENAQMYWLDCNLGSKVTMKYPSIILGVKRAPKEKFNLWLLPVRGNTKTRVEKSFILAPIPVLLLFPNQLVKGGHSTYRGLVKSRAGR